MEAQAEGYENSTSRDHGGVGENGQAVERLPSPFKPSFKFIVNSSSPAQARLTVRKHVMREYRRRERWEQSSKAKPLGPKSPSSKGRNKKVEPEVKERSRSNEGQTLYADAAAYEARNEEIGSSQLTNAKRPRAMGPGVELDSIESFGTDPWAAIAASNLDPFSRAFADCGPAAQAVLHHYAWVRPGRMDELVTGRSFNRIGFGFSCFAVHDPTPLHAILGSNIAHMARLRGIQEPPSAITHKAKALQMIHQRIENPWESTSDATLGGVMCLAGCELMDNNSEMFALHMAGLWRLVDLRGGMVGLAGSPLENPMIRLDVIRAYMAISSPRYPSYSSVQTMRPLAISIPQNDIGQVMDPDIDKTQQESYRHCEDALVLVHGLEDLMELLGSTARNPFVRLNISLKDLLSCAVTQLLSKGPVDLDDPNGRSYLSRRCCRLAVLLFVDVAIKEIFDSPDPPGRYVRKLKSDLVGITTLWSRSLEILMMILLQHDRIALEKPWRWWYVADVVMMTMNIGQTTWRAIEETLLAYIGGSTFEASQTAQSGSIWDMQSMTQSFVQEWF